jgi:hypothetical protein
MIFEKKNLPSNKEDMLESFNIDRVVQSDYYTRSLPLQFLDFLGAIL